MTWQAGKARNFAHGRQALCESRLTSSLHFQQKIPSPGRACRAPVSQVPYYPQYPTGPLGWPPQGQQAGQSQYSQHGYGGVSGSPYAGQSGYPPSYNPLTTNPLTLTPGPAVQSEGAGSARSDGYTLFYGGFGPRLSAGLIDLVFMVILQLPIISGLFWANMQTQPRDFTGWLGLYGPFTCLGLLILVSYPVVCWSAWGKTLGKQILGIRVVAADGNIPGFGRSVLRVLGYVFSLLSLGFGFIMIALDPLAARDCTIKG